ARVCSPQRPVRGAIHEAVRRTADARGRRTRSGGTVEQRCHRRRARLCTRRRRPATARVIPIPLIHNKKGDEVMDTPAIVSAADWQAARQQLLVKEKEVLRARDVLAAERRRMPWLAVDKPYAFVGPAGNASLLDLFAGRRQLIVYRAFFEPGVDGWPEHACRGCSMIA